MGKLRGYNIHLQLGDKMIKGATDHDFSIEAEIEESLNKESAGVKTKEFVSYDASFSVNLEFNEKETEEAATHLDITDLRAAIVAGTVFAFAHGGTSVGDNIATGNLIIKSYKDTSNSKDYATASISCEVTGALSFSTVSA